MWLVNFMRMNNGADAPSELSCYGAGQTCMCRRTSRANDLQCMCSYSYAIVDYCKPTCKTVSLHAKISAYLDGHNYDLHLSIYGGGDRCGHLGVASLLQLPPGQAVFCQLLWEEDLRIAQQG